MLAGKSTLNRLGTDKERVREKERHKKIVLDHGAADRLPVEVFLQAHREETKEFTGELAMPHRGSAAREPGRTFLPWLLWTLLLPAVSQDSAESFARRARNFAIVEHRCVVGERRGTGAHRGPDSFRVAEVRIVVRGDSGFCREELMAWCEANRVEYVLGLAKKERWKTEIAKEMAEAKAQYQRRRATRLFKEFFYQTLKSWSRVRRVVAKAEHLERGEKPAIRSDLSERRSMAGTGAV